MRPTLFCLSILLIGSSCALLCSCAGPKLTSNKPIPSPLSVLQQQDEILKIAPLKTPRPEVERRLKAAGVEISSGISQSVCYCDFWNRKEGARWRIDIALMFDSNDQLYAIRQGSASTAVGDGEPLSGPVRTGAENARVARPDQANDGGNREEPSSRGRIVGSPFTKM